MIGVGGYQPCRAFRGNPFGRYHYGWYATGSNVPKAGRIRWGRLGYVRAYLDCVRLARVAGTAPEDDQ